MDIQNWFGLTNGKYIGEPPHYVDKQRPPGMSEVPQTSWIKWLKAAPFVLITSPNFVWATLSLLLYAAAPYQLDPERFPTPLSVSFLSQRLALWIPVVLGYTGFWHVALYWFQLANRPFVNRSYNPTKVLHNLTWTTSGIFLWTCYENVVCYLWATGRLPYISDAISFTTPLGVIGFLVALAAVPVWRSLHFYFAHRFLHFPAMYQQVHSLHHRNTDTEPFSGLCMHPVEHLYYYACIAPSLVYVCSPYAFLWNGVHLLLSPAASHSGYEDHFQSDVFHYMHHRYFECNYAGTDAAWLDQWFGTFKGSMALEDGVPQPRADAKSTLFAVPTTEFMTYLGGSAACFVPWIITVNSNSNNSTYSSIAIASLAGFGPVLLSVLVSNLFRMGRGVGAKSMSLVATLGHVGIGTLFCSIPVMYMIWLTLQQGAQ